MTKAESEAAFAWTLLDELPCGVSVIDGDGTLRYVNHFWSLLFAQAEGATEVGADFFARVLPALGAAEDIAALGRAVRAALSGRRAQVVEISIIGAGGPRWLAVRLNPIATPEGRRVMLYLLDITSTNALAADSLKLKQKLAHHLRDAPLGIIEWNAKFECVEWNPVAEKIFGYSRRDALGRRADDLVLRRESSRDLWAELLTTGRGNHSVIEHAAKDGGVVFCEWHNTPIADHDGRVIGVSSVVQDVTERRRTMELLESNARAQEQRATEAEREMKDKARLLAELDQQLAIVAQQSQQILDLSMPILELRDDVLAVPIIGAMDAHRSDLLMNRLLPTIAAKEARWVILDLTGVDQVDTTAASYFNEILKAVRFLGATGILTGIRPAVSRAMIELGVELSAIATFRSLREGLAACNDRRKG